MKTSEKGIELITQFEGLKLKAYKCSAGVWTIGYGHTGEDVKEGKEITAEEAKKLLAADLKRFENSVNRSVKKPINQNQFDSLVSISLNIGVSAFERSTLLKVVNEDPNQEKIEAEFLKWKLAKGKVVQGLLNRRKQEVINYFK